MGSALPWTWGLYGITISLGLPKRSTATSHTATLALSPPGPSVLLSSTSDKNP